MCDSSAPRPWSLSITPSRGSSIPSCRYVHDERGLGGQRRRGEGEVEAEVETIEEGREGGDEVEEEEEE